MKASKETGARHEKPDNESEKTEQIDQHQQQAEAEQAVHLCPCVMRWLSFIAWIGPSPRSITRKGANMNISAKMIARHDEQDAAEDDEAEQETTRDEDRQAEIFPERLRMPKRGKLDGLGIVVGGEIEGRRAHADQRAEARDD